LHQEHGWLVLNSSLCDVGLAATQLLAALGLMAILATIVAGVIAGSLAFADAAAIKRPGSPAPLARLALTVACRA